MDLFTHAMYDRMKSEAPLAARMRGILRMPAHAGRVRRAGQASLKNSAAEAGDRSRPAILVHPAVGAAEDRQNHPGDGHRQPHQEPLRDAFGGASRQGGVARGD